MKFLNPTWLLIALASGTTAYLLVPKPGSLQAQSQTPPPSVAVVNRVGALGRLQPAGRVITVGGPTGERVGELLVAEGDVVQQGEVIARLDNYGERLAERNYAASQLAEAQAQLSSTTTRRRLEIAEVRSRLQQADLPRQREILSQQALIRQLEAELADAQTNLRRFQDLFQQGAVSQQDLDQRQLAVEQTQESLNSGRATLAQLESARSTDLTTIQTQVQVAEANYQAVPSEIPVQSLARNVELAEARLERSLIRAPQSGQILRIRRYPGEVIDQEGIVQLGDTSRMFVVAEVYETDVPRVQVGQRVSISSPAFPETLEGRVDFVGLQIGRKDVLSTNPAEDVDARVVEVKIQLDPEDNALAARLTNMQVTVTIDVDANSQPTTAG
ncbi:MAG: ABC exporter membrane fusion protein [Synechococcales cyanobacterium]